ncbi:SusC/RagA family TonB-linked outer membrane protein [Marinilabilia rubra]|uniref:SusC/RagA family TonB-linked outer membrane protein n=1 Tax=Marinilabilia rubra TaxID=2162893 RepID=A0A2U2B3C8_9BACT|nr:SusC/RagA family TonB-linked outer membrane protein [Marinilabilia rubra]PWD97560.1 SusC/RagA family TonB-linked outer membrane protein [Marinilabilia rubra]
MKKVLLALSFLMVIGLGNLFGQAQAVTGTVTGSEDGMPIPGVSVFVKGTTVGTVTQPDGTYSLNVPQDADAIVFSFVGMETQEIPYEGQSTINVGMVDEAFQVDEVIVTALGIKRERKALGYAVQDVDSEEIGRTGNSDLAGAMQGKLAGMDIKPSSGMPGASSQIVIRGARSFTGNNTPLYVVDGMPIASTSYYDTGNSVTGADISNRAVDINPADIESINVLKGQAAAALYGIRASNGVVIITTKSGANNKVGKPVVRISHNSSFDVVSRTPDYQSTWAQGNYGSYVPNTSLSWGPKISELPNSPTYGGNTDNAYTQEDGMQQGKFYVPQLAQAGLDPWKEPRVYENWDDYYQTGYKSTNSVNVSQAFETGSFAIALTNTTQDGIALNTGMDRWNFKGSGVKELNDNFTVGFSSNYVKLEIDKLSGANDASLAGVLSAPASYNLEGYPYHEPGDPYSQIYYRSMTFDNPYWVAQNNTFNEKTERFFGNGYVEYSANIAGSLDLDVKYQLGVDSYTTHFQDIFEYGSKGGAGVMDNYGVTSATYNSLLTASLNWSLSDNSTISATFGNELNHEEIKAYSEHGEDFNFGGWSHIQNANVVTADESQSSERTVGFFGSLSYDWKSMLFLNATGRNDYVSTMPRGNRSFFYPSVSLGFVASELEPVKALDWISYAKIRGSYAEVGQAGDYINNYFTKPDYSGGFWTGEPIQYPIDGVNSYISNNVQYDPNLKPQNTTSYEVGVNLKFFNNRFGIDYTYSRQDVEDQIFQVPLAASTGAAGLVMNGGAVHTNTHEAILYATPIKIGDFTWDIAVNYSKIDNVVDELASGVESIFLGGFVTPQVRAGIGNTYPVIYGASFKRDDQGRVLVVDNPGAWNHGMPEQGEPAVIGEVSPEFILGGTNTFSYKTVSLSAVFEWKNGGEMYSGSNGLLDLYGMSARTEDRESTFIYDGYKPNGEKNDIVRGGVNDPDAIQDLYVNVLSNIDEYYIHENSFVKLRELALSYKHPTKVFGSVDLGVSVFARNILLWTALPNFDPEASQGNNNMGGSFERFSLPQTTSYGFGIDVTF